MCCAFCSFCVGIFHGRQLAALRLAHAISSASCQVSRYQTRVNSTTHLSSFISIILSSDIAINWINNPTVLSLSHAIIGLKPAIMFCRLCQALHRYESGLFVYYTAFKVLELNTGITSNLTFRQLERLAARAKVPSQTESGSAARESMMHPKSLVQIAN